MYICMCNAITEKELRDLAREYPGETLEQLYGRMGVQVDCGSCLTFGRHILVEEHSPDVLSRMTDQPYKRAAAY